MTTEQQLSELDAREQYRALLEQIRALQIKLWLIPESQIPRNLWEFRLELDCKYGYPTEEVARKVEAAQQRQWEEEQRIEADRAEQSVWHRIRSFFASVWVEAQVEAQRIEAARAERK